MPITVTKEDVAHAVRRVEELAGAIKRHREGKRLTAIQSRLILECNQDRDDASKGLKREYPSMAACSGATGISMEAIKDAKSKGAPAFDHGRVQLAPLIRWLSRSTDDDDEDVSNWSEELCRVKTLRERIRLAEDEGRVIDFSKVVEGAGLMMSILFGRLDRMANQLPPSLKGLDELAIKRRIEAETEALRTDIKAKFAETAKGKEQ